MNVMGKDKDRLEIKAIFVLSIILMIIISSTVSIYQINKHDNRGEIKMSDLRDRNSHDNVGYPAIQLCTVSVESKFYICEDDTQSMWGWSIYEMTQEQMDDMLKECPDGKFIDTTECIGDYLTLNISNVGEH